MHPTRVYPLTIKKEDTSKLDFIDLSQIKNNLPQVNNLPSVQVQDKRDKCDKCSTNEKKK